jgi:hypothetical protein
MTRHMAVNSKMWIRSLTAAALSMPLVGDSAQAELLSSLSDEPTLRVIDAATGATVSLNRHADDGRQLAG